MNSPRAAANQRRAIKASLPTAVVFSLAAPRKDPGNVFPVFPRQKFSARLLLFFFASPPTPTSIAPVRGK